MTIEITAERALELLREVVAEYGEDYVYVNPQGQRAGDDDDNGDQASCWYVHGDKPGCIAGHVYHRAGLSLETLKLMENNGASHPGFRQRVTGEGPTILSIAQDRQDKGETWGQALRAAVQTARGL